MNIEEVKKTWCDRFIRLDIKWLIEQYEKQQSQIRELILAIYENANEGTALMELAKKIDSED